MDCAKYLNTAFGVVSELKDMACAPLEGGSSQRWFPTPIVRNVLVCCGAHPNCVGHWLGQAADAKPRIKLFLKRRKKWRTHRKQKTQFGAQRTVSVFKFRTNLYWVLLLRVVQVFFEYIFIVFPLFELIALNSQV